MENKQVVMIRGLVRAAELLEARDSVTAITSAPLLWDDEARIALEIARDCGWGKNQVGTVPPAAPVGEFEVELQHLINRHSLENGSGTPDFLLAAYLVGCLENWNKFIRERDQWRTQP